MKIFNDVDDAVDYFKSLLLKTAQEHILYKTITIRPQEKPWFTIVVCRIYHKKDGAHTKWGNKSLYDVLFSLAAALQTCGGSDGAKHRSFKIRLVELKLAY